MNKAPQAVGGRLQKSCIIDSVNTVCPTFPQVARVVNLGASRDLVPHNRQVSVTYGQGTRVQLASGTRKR